MIHAGEKIPGIVHRDLKPENVLIDPSRQAKITDFGLATAAQKARLQLEAAENTTDKWHSLHGARGVVGTPPYMPPEQWHGGEIDARADIYAVGCILYELVTGQPPFSANSLRGFYEQHCRAPIPYLSEQPLLAPILMHCLAKRPDGRFNTVNDLLTELEHVYLRQFGQPVKPLLPETRFTALDHHNRGVTYHRLGQYARAVGDFSTAIDLYPAFAEAYLWRGFCKAEMGQKALANDDIRRAFELGPVVSSPSDMYYNRGTFWMEHGHLDNATADFTRAIDLDPTDAQSYNNRGLCYYHRQLFIEAIIDFSRALELKPDHAKAYNNRGNALALLGDDARAVNDFTRAIELLPTYTKAYNNRAMSYQKLGLYSEAIFDYKRAIELDPSYGLAYMNLGALLLKLDRKEDALKVFERAAQLGIPQATHSISSVKRRLNMRQTQATTNDFHDPNFYLNRGIERGRQGDHKGAIADFDQAIQLNPEMDEAYLNRAVSHDKVGDFKRAIADCDQAIRLNPQMVSAYRNRGTARSAIGDLQGAIADYDQAINLNPYIAETYYNRGVTRFQIGDLQGAIVDFSHAIRLNPQIGEAYYNRGLARAQSSDPIGAIADFSHVIRLNLGINDAYSNRGVARFQIDDLQGAIADFSHVIRLDPTNAHAYHSRGLARFKYGDLKGALEDFNQAKRIAISNDSNY